MTATSRNRPGYFSQQWRLLTVLAGVLLVSVCGTLHADDESLQRIFAGKSPPRSIEDLRAMQAAQQKLAAKAIKVTVGVQIGPAQGSGVIISPEGLVLTAAHVAQKPGLPVKFIMSDGTIHRGETLGLNRDIDAGMMKISSQREGGWPHVKLADLDEVRQGQWVMAMGHPGGYMRGRRPVVRLGRLLSKRASVLTTDCPLIGGDSGGPLFDMKGDVIGINSRIGGALTANMHVPVSTFEEDWDRLVNSEMWGSVPRGEPYIGVSGGSEKQKGVEGALIEWVKPGGPGEKSGLQAGDVVKRFGNKSLEDFQQLVIAVSGKKPGDKVPLKVQRGEKVIDLKLVIGKAGR